MPPAHAIQSARERLLDEGLRLLLMHGYNSLGVQTLLDAAGVPKGSFYHHFESKQDFALKVIDRYMEEVHAGLDACLNAPDSSSLERIRRFFELSRDKYGREGYLGCMLGGLGQELSGVNDTFRSKIEGCFSHIAERLAACLAQAREAGEVPGSVEPRQAADLLLNCWEGAALRSRLWRDPMPLDAVLDFCFSALRSGAAASGAGAPEMRSGAAPDRNVVPGDDNAHGKTQQWR
ncbi:MAG TPA: TetR family transcriptional regulator C-terminal domain-containing protein [Xanthomonadaceae bacterium]|nr:TetR family transcriptional regulator C-terminal domain-containing protein [Xanthomonadaceae bacterium]